MKNIGDYKRKSRFSGVWFWLFVSISILSLAQMAYICYTLIT